MKNIEKSRGVVRTSSNQQERDHLDTYTINVSTPNDMMHVHNRRNTTRCMMLSR